MIPYQILKTSEATPFVSARYHTAGEATPLTISIKQDDWNKAPSGRLLRYRDIYDFLRG